jgi:hypothetical protein
MLHMVRLFVLTALLVMLPQWGNQAQQLLQTSILDGLGVDPSNVQDQYNQLLVVKRDTGTDRSWWDILGDLNSFTVELLISGFLWLFGQFASLLLFWAYIIQKFILFTAYALSPLLIGFMAIHPLRSVGGRYLMHIVGVLLWPLGWAVAALITQGILDFMTDPSLKFIDPTATLIRCKPQSALRSSRSGLCSAPFLRRSSSRRFSATARSRADNSSQVRLAVSSRQRPPPLARQPSHPPPVSDGDRRCGRRDGRRSEHTFDRRWPRQRRGNHHRWLWLAAALRSRSSWRRHHRRQVGPRTHRQRQRQLLLTLWKPPNSTLVKRPLATAHPHASPGRNLTRHNLFAQRDRLPWFWFFVAVAVSVLAALDRYHIIKQFKQRERVVIIDPAQTYYISPLLQFAGGEGLARAAG